MDMSKELRNLLKEHYQWAAKVCSECTHKCYLYVLVTYIHENGYEYFYYQLEHNSLPEAIDAAFEQFVLYVGFERYKKASIILQGCPYASNSN